jgi:hypothetical protein
MKNTETFAWQPLLDDVLHESGKEQLQQKLGELEGTMFFRFQELQKSADGAVEVSKLQSAASMLLEVKINKLGFPVTGLRGLRNRAAK